MPTSPKCAIITGASSGIGAATAKAYGRAGIETILLARNEDGLEATADAIRAEGGKTDVYPVDLANPAAVAAVAEAVLAEKGTPDILINNAGAGRWRSVLETSAEELQDMMAVPFFAAFNLTRVLLPAMIAKRRGAIACITSPGSYFAWPHAAAYIAARHAMKGFAEALRSEVRSDGITVTLVMLGEVKSPYWEHNPGSRQYLIPANRRLMPPLSVDQAAEIIIDGVARKKRLVVAPWALRPILVLNALFPGLVASQIRKAAKRAATKE